MRLFEKTQLIHIITIFKNFINKSVAKEKVSNTNSSKQLVQPTSRRVSNSFSPVKTLNSKNIATS